MSDESAQKEETQQGMPTSVQKSRVSSFCRLVFRRAGRWLYPVFILLGIPQLFVFSYFFRDLCTRHNPLGFIRNVAALGFSVSLTMAPLLVALLLIGRLCIRKQVKLRWISLGALICGCILIPLWNECIYPTFEYWRSILPFLLCYVSALLIPVARVCYRRLIRETLSK